LKHSSSPDPGGTGKERSLNVAIHSREEIRHFIDRLGDWYAPKFGPADPRVEAVVLQAADFALGTISKSDASYHDADHTISVTLAGQAILEGLQLSGTPVTKTDWAHVTVALLLHDIGYARGICRADRGNRIATGIGDAAVDLPAGCTDAALADYHVDRATLFVRERFAAEFDPHGALSADAIAAYIETTRFPFPRAKNGKPDPLAECARAADLIGQLGDPERPRKCEALFREFEEIGINPRLGYRTPADLRKDTPHFYRKAARPHILRALGYLALTGEGRQWIANLEANVGERIVPQNTAGRIMDDEWIRRCPLFASLPREELADLLPDPKVAELGNGDVLFFEGDPGDRFYIVLSGELEVVKAAETREERVLNRLSPGDYLGEISLLEPGGVRTATVRASGDSRLLEMTREDFDRLLQRRPSLAFHIARVLGSRLREADHLTIRDLQEKNRQLDQAYRDLQAAQAHLIEKEKLEHELSLAREIQSSMLPRSIPSLEGFEFGACMTPAKAVGGDFFDFIPLAPGLLGIAVGDVSGKGVPAALFMAMARSLLRAEAHKNASPREVLERVNHHLMDLNEGEMFVTVLYGVLDARSQCFEYARAGHEFPVMCDDQGRVLPLPRGKGQALGVFDAVVSDEQKIHVAPGSTLLLYSDGLTDAVNAENECFGIAQVHRSLPGMRREPAQSMCNRFVELVAQHQAGVARFDDVTVVVIQNKRGHCC
jgi:serine phosphatase RsbU (regulator of sigma subunit)